VLLLLDIVALSAGRDVQRIAGTIARVLCRFRLNFLKFAIKSGARL
jgi:hypothetical protein